MSSFFPQEMLQTIAITTRYLTDVLEFAERLLWRNKWAYSGFPDQLFLKLKDKHSIHIVTGIFIGNQMIDVFLPQKLV